MVARSQSGERTIAASDFFTGFLESALAPDELLTEIRVPKIPRRGLVVPEVQPPRAGLGDRRRRRGAQRHDGHRAREHGPDSGASDARSSRRSPAARQPPTPRSTPAEGASPSADLNASVEYREHLARVLVRRALEQAGA